MTPARRPKATLTRQQLLAASPPALRALALEAREVILAAAPSLEERVLPGWRALGYRDARAGHLCALFPLPGELKLYFEHGATLADPDGLLEGNLKHTRFLRLRTRKDLRKTALRRLVQRALLARSL